MPDDILVPLLDRPSVDPLVGEGLLLPVWLERLAGTCSLASLSVIIVSFTYCHPSLGGTRELKLLVFSHLPYVLVCVRCCLFIEHLWCSRISNKMYVVWINLVLCETRSI